MFSLFEQFELTTPTASSANSVVPKNSGKSVTDPNAVLSDGDLIPLNT